MDFSKILCSLGNLLEGLVKLPPPSYIKIITNVFTMNGGYYVELYEV